jgi:hypothetical protein
MFVLAVICKNELGHLIFAHSSILPPIALIGEFMAALLAVNLANDHKLKLLKNKQTKGGKHFLSFPCTLILFAPLFCYKIWWVRDKKIFENISPDPKVTTNSINIVGYM